MGETYRHTAKALQLTNLHVDLRYLLRSKAKCVYELKLIYTSQKMEPHSLIWRCADHENLSLNSEYFDRFLEKKWW